MRVTINMTLHDEVEVCAVILTCRASAERLIKQIKTDADKVWPLKKEAKP